LDELFDRKLRPFHESLCERIDKMAKELREDLAAAEGRLRVSAAFNRADVTAVRIRTHPPGCHRDP
jgi:hypothetical protein